MKTIIIALLIICSIAQLYMLRGTVQLFTRKLAFYTTMSMIPLSNFSILSTIETVFGPITALITIIILAALTSIAFIHFMQLENYYKNYKEEILDLNQPNKIVGVIDPVDVAHILAEELDELENTFNITSDVIDKQNLLYKIQIKKKELEIISTF